MALRQLILAKKIEGLRKQLDDFIKLDEGFVTRRANLKTRETELETALNEITEETSAEDKKTYDDSVAAFEADATTLDADEAKNKTDKEKLESDIRTLQAELDALNEQAKEPDTAKSGTERKDESTHMENRTKFYGLTTRERTEFFAREDMKNFISEIRSIKTRGVTNGSLTIPDIALEILRDNMDQYSKLINYVGVKKVGGTARQNIVGVVPEGVWMEATGALNDLDMSFNQIEVDGFMVGGIIWVHNVLLEDSDIALGGEIMAQLGQAIGKGVDRAILFGTGTKMPVGIATRLAQTSSPDNWGTYAPAWTDLHTTNVKKLNIDGTTGATFYASLIATLGIAKPNYTNGQAFWVMNRATHIKLMTKALAFDAAAALIAGVNNQMPIIGGDIVELEMLEDDNIIGGYGSAYLLAERAGAKVDSSEHAKYKEMLTGFRGYARYDGMPIFGEAFIQVSFANADATTESTFPLDTTNPTLGALTITSTAHTSTAGSSDITMTGGQTAGTFFGYKVGAKATSVEYGAYHTGFTPIAFTAGAATLADFADADDNKIITVVEFYYGIAIAAGSIALKVKKTT